MWPIVSTLGAERNGEGCSMGRPLAHLDAKLLYSIDRVLYEQSRSPISSCRPGGRLPAGTRGSPTHGAPMMRLSFGRLPQRILLAVVIANETALWGRTE